MRGKIAWPALVRYYFDEMRNLFVLFSLCILPCWSKAPLLLSKSQFQTQMGVDRYDVALRLRLPAQSADFWVDLVRVQSLLGSVDASWKGLGAQTWAPGVMAPGLLHLQIPPGRTPDYGQLCSRLEKLASVQYCDLVPLGTPPPAILGVDSGPPAQNWEDKQGYFSAAPLGIDARFAWDLGVEGQGIALHDAEWAWNQEHEEWAPALVQMGLEESSESFADHGTAVLGILLAGANGYGVRGALPRANGLWTYSELTDAGRLGAISAALTHAKAGDVLILEMQTQGCEVNGDAGQYAPADYNSSVWDLVRQATDAGIVVLEAAGNGRQNLDAACYDDYHARGDNGAILVGAGNAGTLATAAFSSYGSRVDLQAWGNNSVYSTGYGGLYNGGANSTYTASFGGTSAALPIVAAAAGLVQSWSVSHLGRALSPREMRSLLIQTGTAQSQDSHPIGPQPNVRAALEYLASSAGISLSSSALQSSSSQVQDLSSSSAWVDPGLSSAQSPVAHHFAFHLSGDGMILSAPGNYEVGVLDVQGRRRLQWNLSQAGFYAWPELGAGIYQVWIRTPQGASTQWLWIP